VGQTITTNVSTPVFQGQTETRNPLYVLNAGSVVKVIGIDHDWYRIEFRIPQFGGPYNGFVAAKYITGPSPTRLEPVDLSIPELRATRTEPIDLSISELKANHTEPLDLSVPGAR
jgi:hypothetical protein